MSDYVKVVEEIAKIIEMHTVRRNVKPSEYGKIIASQSSSLDIARDICGRIVLIKKYLAGELVEQGKRTLLKRFSDEEIEDMEINNVKEN